MLTTIECGVDEHGNYYEQEVETLHKKNIRNQNMSISDTLGPTTADESPWLRNWISPTGSDSDGDSDGPEGLVDSASGEDLGDADPEEGIDPSDFTDDKHSVAEVAWEGLHQSLQQVPASY